MFHSKTNFENCSPGLAKGNVPEQQKKIYKLIQNKLVILESFLNNHFPNLK